MDSSAVLKTIKNEKGMALIYVALAIIVMFGFLALAVDASHLLLVRGELQTGADAAALAGAAHLYRQVPGEIPVLDFPAAQEAARDFIKQNRSDAAALADGVVKYGYRNSAGWEPGSPVSSGTPVPLTATSLAAVSVTISRSDGNNGGKVKNYFARVLKSDGSLDSSPVTSLEAIAVSGFPNGAPPGSLFPMVLSNCMTDHYFSQDPLPNPPPQIVISSPYIPGGATCESGQWTSFTLDASDARTARTLVDSGNTVPIQTGEDVWVQPGAEASIYPYVDDWLPPEGRDVLMAIVDTSVIDLKTKGERTVTGFATFHIDGATGGSSKIVYGHFIEYFDHFPGIKPGGPPSNTVTPPMMVQ